MLYNINYVDTFDKKNSVYIDGKRVDKEKEDKLIKLLKDLTK